MRLVRPRRTPVVIGAVALAVTLICSCSSGGSSKSSGGGVGTDGSVAVTPEKDLIFAGPGAGLGDSYKKVLNEYTSAHGINLTYVEGLTAANFTKVQTQVRSKSVAIDIVQLSETLDPQGKAAGLFEDLKPSLVPNISQLSAFAQPTKTTGLIGLASPYGLFYNTKVFAQNGWDAPTSWSDLYNPKYAGCVSLPDTGSAGTNAAMLVMLNKIASKGYTDIKAGLALLDPVKSKVAVQTSTDALQSVSQGSKCLSVFTQGRVLQAAATGSPVAYVIPKEGSPINAVTFEVVKGAPHPIAAQQAINHMLSAEAQAELFATYFSPTNKTVATPTTGPQSKIFPPADFQKLGAFQLPPEAVTNFADWARMYDAMFAK
jgi:putative spermidine/putrescine transport system substrate-binding protein